MTEHVLPVLLADVDDRLAVRSDRRATREVLGVREEVAPLRLEEVDHVEVFRRGLDMAAIDGQEMHVGVAAHPAAGSLIGPAADRQLELALPGFDPDAGTEGFVLETPDDLDQDVAFGQPTLATSIDHGIGHGAQPDVAADVHVPARDVAVDVAVVAVRLPGDARG